jgi:hypothetical protein
VEGFVLTVGAKFAAHLNSYSQPSAKLVAERQWLASEAFLVFDSEMGR